MFSVTQRIERIQQPKLGYIPPRTLEKIEYFDGNEINKINPAHKHIQGMVVDYFSRFMSGASKEDAFKISLLGAKEVDEKENAIELLNQINGLDSTSIRAACQLVCYDVAYRRGPNYFVATEKIIPNNKMIDNIIILVKRALVFFKKNGPVVLDGFTFKGGYNNVISSGDGDFLTTDTLWDFKVSKAKPTSNHTLQLLVYYILGIHSIHPEFQNIKKLGIFNPELNIEYTIKISDIPEEVFQAVSRDVIGYNTPKEASQWRNASGTSVKVMNELKSYFYSLFTDTGFSPDKYEDGIHNITIDDYWTYYRKITDNRRPKFSRTNSVKFIKNSGYFMFVSLTENGTASLLQGGNLHRLKRPLQYYYERLPEYATAILHKFSKYWDALYNISKQIQSVSFGYEEAKKEYAQYKINCEKQEINILDFETWYKYREGLYCFSGKVHGCIVDIDYYNHIYLNPYDGTIVPYSAPSMYTKYVYKNVTSLISAERPEMLPAFNRAVENSLNDETTALILVDSKKNETLSVLKKDEIDTYNMLVTDTDMYAISNRIKQLQTIYDYNLVVVWYDDILPHYELEDEVKKVKKKTPQKPKKKNLLPKTKEKISYIGKASIMNCGLKATVIEDFGCNNITVQFEDGLIKKNCRRDKFREGKIGHRI